MQLDNQRSFQKRINYQGDLNPVLSKICQDFKIGRYQSYKIVSIGYEDLNLIVKTDEGKFFIKIFATFRDERECKRYIKIMEEVVNGGVNHPKLFQYSQGSLYLIINNGATDRLCVMEYIDGKSYFQLQTNPSRIEIEEIIKQTALINKINLKPFPVYDSWAIVNLLSEFESKGNYLSKEDYNLVYPYTKLFSTLKIDELPHCFVHGDITKTNTMRSNQGKLYILDFAVANWYPRIQELAVILCDLFFNKDDNDVFPEIYKSTMSNYQQYMLLTSHEIKILPIYLQFAHVMHLLRANYELVVNHHNTEENMHFLTIGREGLLYTARLFQNKI